MASDQVVSFADFKDVIPYLALIISATALWRVREIKELDLRLELQKIFNDFELVISGIESYLDFVCESHLRVMAATGELGSGAEIAFKSDFQKDKELLQTLLSSAPIRKGDYKGSSQKELEMEIVTIHSLRNQISAVRTKYQKILDADDERRKEIRAAIKSNLD